MHECEYSNNLSWVDFLKKKKNWVDNIIWSILVFLNDITNFLGKKTLWWELRSLKDMSTLDLIVSVCLPSFSFLWCYQKLFYNQYFYFHLQNEKERKNRLERVPNLLVNSHYLKLNLFPSNYDWPGESFYRICSYLGPICMG